MSRHQIDYESLTQDAMRGLVRTVLQRVAKSGLPGEHHFYISFYTRAAGVTVSKRLLERYPDEMTIVLQNKFSNLGVREDAFDVTLWFDSIPERLTVPFAAIKVFFDPSVPYGHQFELTEAQARSMAEVGAPRTGDRPPDRSAELAAERMVERDLRSRPVAERPAPMTTVTSSPGQRSRPSSRPEPVRPAAAKPSAAVPAPTPAKPPATALPPASSGALAANGRAAPKKTATDIGSGNTDAEHKPPASATVQADKVSDAPEGPSTNKVVPLDAFRKKS